MKKFLSKLFILSFLFFTFLFFISDVSAVCYKITNKKTNKVTYNTSYEKWMTNSPDYTVETTDDSKCKNVSNSNSNNVSISNNDNGDNYSEGNVIRCGGGLLTDVPKFIPKTIHIVYLLIQIAVPILLVILGSIDFVKAMTSQKDDEIKKGQQIFIKRLIAGVLVFFVLSFVKILISLVGDSNKSKIIDCTSCLINNNSKCVSGS